MALVDQAFWPTIVRVRLLIGLHLEANEGEYLLEWDGLPDLPVYPVFTLSGVDNVFRRGPPPTLSLTPHEAP
jgi:hypothetical protein